MKNKQTIFFAMLTLVGFCLFNSAAIAQTELPAGSYINISTQEAAPYTLRYEEAGSPAVESVVDIEDTFSINAKILLCTFYIDMPGTCSQNDYEYNFILSYEMGEVVIERVQGVSVPRLDLGSGEFSLNPGSSIFLEIPNATVTVGNNPNPALNTPVGETTVEYNMAGPLQIRFNQVNNETPPTDDDGETPLPTTNPDTSGDEEAFDMNSAGGCHLSTMAGTNAAGFSSLGMVLVLGLGLRRFSTRE